MLELPEQLFDNDLSYSRLERCTKARSENCKNKYGDALWRAEIVGGGRPGGEEARLSTRGAHAATIWARTSGHMRWIVPSNNARAAS